MPTSDSRSSLPPRVSVRAEIFRAPAWLEWRQSLIVALPSLMLVVAGAMVFGLFGNQSIFSGMDGAWYQIMVGSRTPGFTWLNLILNFVGNGGIYIYGVLLLVLLFPRHKRLALFIVGANVGTALLTQTIKFLVNRTRPPDRLVSVDSGSYPSGHVSATLAAVLATALIVARLWMWISAAVLSVAMMYSRTYLGAHWLSDTVAGAVLAGGFVTLLWGLMGRYLRNDAYTFSGQP